ncbi:MAG: TraX family protein [Leptolyngbyaceae bacterium]|nr:TraX family protein [Leptolyngbyaceae bacterium]
MTSFQLKLFAAICMVIDHVGVVFYPEETLFRIIGRLSFPLFAWLLTQGEKKTQNIRAYFTRLVIGALISQPFYTLLFEIGQLNILVTLVVGLVVIRLAKRFPSERYLIWLIGLVITAFVPMDAGAYGLCVIFLMAEFPLESSSNHLRWWMLWIGLHILDFLFLHQAVQIWAIASPIPIYLHAMNQRRGPKARWFYGFYPGHLAVLLFIKNQAAALF